MTRTEALHHIAAETGGIVRHNTERHLDHGTGKWRDGESRPVAVRSHGFYVFNDGLRWLIEWMGDLDSAPWYGAVTVLTPDDAITVIREPHRWREMQAKWEAA